MGGRIGIGFSSIWVGLEGQVGRPNRARRGPKHDLTGQGRPRQDQRPRQASQVQSSQGRRGRAWMVLGGRGLPYLKGGDPALKCPPLGVFFVFEKHCFESIAGHVSWRPLGAVWGPCSLQSRSWMVKNRFNFRSRNDASLN